MRALAPRVVFFFAAAFAAAPAAADLVVRDPTVEACAGQKVGARCGDHGHCRSRGKLCQSGMCFMYRTQRACTRGEGKLSGCVWADDMVCDTPVAEPPPPPPPPPMSEERDPTTTTTMPDAGPPPAETAPSSCASTPLGFSWLLCALLAKRRRASTRPAAP